jgi:multidrug resistance efflux pump
VTDPNIKTLRRAIAHLPTDGHAALARLEADLDALRAENERLAEAGGFAIARIERAERECDEAREALKTYHVALQKISHEAADYEDALRIADTALFGSEGEAE